MEIEKLMKKIIDLADKKFETDDDFAIDNINVVVEHNAYGWDTWLIRSTRATLRRYGKGKKYLDNGDTMEVESWFLGEGETIQESLEDLLSQVREAKMIRGKGNRLSPKMEEGL
jgi:hypothetical protein